MLQKKSVSLSGSYEAAKSVTTLLTSLKSREEFDILWKKVEIKSNELELSPPKLPRRRVQPARYRETNASNPEIHDVVENHYQIYDKAVTTLIEALSCRFDQPGLHEYILLESIVTDSNKIDDCAEICQKYGLDQIALKSQLQMFRRLCEDAKSLDEIMSAFSKLHFDVKTLLCDLHGLLKLLLVIPSSSATAERSFSTVRRIKTYLRSTMTQRRLNSLCIANIYAEEMEKLDINEIMATFVNKNDYRVSQFGHC